MINCQGRKIFFRLIYFVPLIRYIVQAELHGDGVTLTDTGVHFPEASVCL